MSDNPHKPKAPRRRFLWVALGGLVVIALAAALALPALLDVERYRGHIERALLAATGWEAELGAIDFSPWRGMVLTVRPASLSAPGDSSRFEVGTIEIRAELWPLLRGRLQIRSIALVEPDIILVRRDADEGWVIPLPPKSDAGAAARPAARGGSAASGPADAAGAGATAEGGGFTVAIGRVSVDNGRVRVQDRASDPPRELELVNLDLAVRPPSGDFSGQGDLAGGGGHLEWNGNVQRGAKVKLARLPTESLHAFVGPDLVHAGGELSGDVDVSFPLALRGKFTGRNVTLLAGEKPFDTVKVDLAVASAGEVWTLADLRVDADGVQVTGAGTLMPGLRLDLELPRTPLDAALRASESVLPLPIDVRPPGDVEATLRVEQPEGGDLFYTAQGSLSAAEFRASAILPPAKDVRASFDLDRRGVLEVRVLEGTVGGGPASGVARLSSVDPPGVLSFDGGLEQAAFGALVEGFLGESAQRITGPTGLAADLALDMGRPEIDARALSGRVDLFSRQVGLPGWDLEGAIRRKIDEQLAELDLEQLVERRLGGKSEEPGAAAAGPATVFDDLGVSIDFDSWPWKLERLTLAADHLSASGAGTFDPIEGLVDLRFTARLDRQRTAELVQKTQQLKLLVDSNGQLALPLHLEGAMLSPAIGVDLGQAFSLRLDSEDTKKKVEGLLKGLIDRD